MSLEAQRDEIIHNLEKLNKQVEKQNSFSRIFVTGIIYGVGFIIGSAVLATIALGALGPWIGQIPWVQNAFQTGKDLIRP